MASPTYPISAERKYRRILDGYYAILADEVANQVIRNLPEILNRSDSERGDVDQNRIETLLNGIIYSWSQRVTVRRATADYASVYASVDRHAERQVKQVLRIAFSNSPRAQAIFNESLKENISLIESIPQELLFGTPNRKGVKDVILEGFQQGKLGADIAKDIQDRFVADSPARARLIARDQIGKLNSAQVVDRFTTAGIEEFIWRTARDGRVRDEHEPLEGQTFSYASGGDPVEGFPGEQIQCRCTMEPIIPDFLPVGFSA